jgi:hypothetical protein
MIPKQFATPPAVELLMAVHRTGGLASICLAALLAAGCGSDPQGDPAPRSDMAGSPVVSAAADPCSLLATDDVAAVIGEQVVGSEASGNRCTYQTEDAMASSVVIEVVASGGAQEMQEARAAAGVIDRVGSDLSDSGGAEGDLGAILTQNTSSPAIGEEAFFGANEQLHVLKGDVYFAVTPPPMRSRMAPGNPLLSTDQKREMASQLAQRIASSL